MSNPAEDEILAKADEAARLLRAMAHGPRLRILCLLVEKELTSGEIARVLAMRGAAASQQLALLRAERLIEARRSGKNVFYALANPLVVDLVGSLRGHFCPAGPGEALPPPVVTRAPPPARRVNRGRWCA
ncbi:MAG: metalloregulator ArsR/SmtB family transcription factor [Proteobacteria bacterium]|nr:metalloregulator ArsR/SmtB family transcription factor [Pseudomonadota bacterium]